ncbi:hypothetical protein HY498_05250 [Candidatus Woesearchaeota archaeon]|nr:hypothetical protein [Candidatus Woesearchaeota archaeon]
MQKTTTRNELQSPEDASLVFSTDAESFNATSLRNADNSDSSKLVSHLGSGYNLNRSSASMSGRIFVLENFAKLTQNLDFNS